MFRYLYSSPVLMTWLSYLVKFGNAIFLLPLIIKNFPEEEVAVWFVFLLILSFSQIADSGFGPSVIRATSYFYAGVKELPKNITEFKEKKDLSNTSINFKGLKSILNTVNIIYLLLGFISVLLLITVGKIIVSNTINMTNNINNLNIAFYIIVFQSFVSIQVIKFNSFMQGVDKVASVKRAETIIESLNIIFSIIILILGFGLLELVIVNLFFKILLFLNLKYFVKKWFKSSENNYKTKYIIDKYFFQSIWSPTWRQGLMYYGGYLTNNGTALVVSQINNPKLIASFLITQKIIFFIRQISQAPLYSNLPRVFQMMAKNNYFLLKKYCSKNIALGLMIQFFGLFSLLVFGNQILELFDTNISLASFSVMFVMSVSIMLELHHAFHAQVYMGSNHVPFLWPAIVSGVAITGFSFLIIDIHGLIGIVLVQFLVQLSLNNWYPVYLNLKLLNWDFWDYLKSLFNFKELINLTKT